MNKKRVSVVYPAQNSSNYDVASGYVDAFRLLGHVVNAIPYHQLYKDWNEYFRFFGLYRGIYDFEFDKEDVARSASLHVVIKVMETDPDIVVIIDGTGLHKDAYQWLRKFRETGVETVVVATESPYHDKYIGQIAEYVNMAFTNERASATNMGIHYLPTAYNSVVHHPILVPKQDRHDVVFVGSGFPERQAMLEGVDWNGIDLYLAGFFRFEQTHPLAEYYKAGALHNSDAAALYSGAKISINLNRTAVDYDANKTIEDAESLSPRAYEVPASGGFLISEWRAEIDDIFDGCVPTFKTPQELDALIHYYLDPANELERVELSDMQREAVTKAHSYCDRARELLRKVNAV